MIGAVLLFGLFAGHGCKKPEDDLGRDLLDPADTLGLRQVDTVSILAWSKELEPVRTSALSVNVLGSYLDERFGPVSAGIVTQVRLSTNNVGPANPDWVCDSLILSLAFFDTSPLYGDLDPQVITVRRLDETLSLDSIYNNDHYPVVLANDLVEGAPRTFTPQPYDGPIIDGDSLNAQLRIPLSTDLGNELLSHWGGAELVDNTAFLNYFKGLYIAPDNGAQAVLQAGVWTFNLLNGVSKLTLYYHDSTDPTPAHFDFVIGSSAVRYTTSVFDHAAAPTPGVPDILADSTLGQQEIYVQALGGMRSELRFPFLDRYAGTELRAVAKAELVVPISGTYHATYLPPTQLFLFRKSDDTGEDLLLPDQIAGQGDIGGVFNATDQEYRFNITRWVQGVINGTYANTGLSLVPGSSGISVNRATLSGPANATPMKLLLTFTTY